jgi:hypothetical protein
MTSLSRLPLEVFENVSPLLRIHHLGRLYMTGDKTVQVLVQNIRKRRFKFSGVSSQPSEMVRRVLAGTATDVEAGMMHLFASPPDRSNFAWLTRLAMDDDGPQVSFNSDLDFSWIRTLEHLDFGKAYVLFKSIKLPASITSVSLGAVASVAPIHDVESLPWLTTLGISGFPFVDDTVQPFFAATSSWPDSLVNLTVVTKSAPTQFVPHLPETVATLTLTMGGGYYPVDLAVMCRRHKSLTSLVVNCGLTRISRPLPATLGNLHLNSLSLNLEDTLLKTFERLPPDIRIFTCTFFTRAGSTIAPLSVGDAEAALRLVVPRVTLKSAETLIGAVLRSDVCFSQDFVRFVANTCEAHGLRDSYLQWKNLRTFKRDLSSMHAAYIMDHAVSEEAALRIIDDRHWSPDDATFSSSNAMMVSYWHQWRRMLELGLINVMHLAHDLRGNHILPTEAIFNLVTMRVNAVAIDAFRQLVKFNKLVCLEKIELVWHSTVTDVVLLAIHQYRANLPRLEKVVLPWLPHTRAVRNACALLKRDMRLHLSENGLELVYRVSSRRGRHLVDWRSVCAKLLQCTAFALVVVLVFAIFG